MTWWSWIIGRRDSLGAELAFVNAQFYLVFVGSAAIVVGLATAAVPACALGAVGGVRDPRDSLDADFRNRVYHSCCAAIRPQVTRADRRR